MRNHKRLAALVFLACLLAGFLLALAVCGGGGGSIHSAPNRLQKATPALHVTPF